MHADPAGRRAEWRVVAAVAVACGVASAACFSNALDAEFVFDDNGAIVENPDVVGPGALWDKVLEMATHDYWGNDMRVSSHKSYRPITILRSCLPSSSLASRAGLHACR